MNRVNEERRARRESEGLVYGPHHRWMETQRCVLAAYDLHECGFTREQPQVKGHHIKRVASGGEDRNNQLPVCAFAHIEFHGHPISFMCDRYGVDFRSLACEITARYDRETADTPEEE